MKRICIIGNSHVACMKLGWKSIGPQHRDVEITYFASPGQSLNDLTVDAGRLVPGSNTLRTSFARTSGGNGDIDPAAFDVFLIVGLLPAIPMAASLALHYRPHTFDGLESEHLISEELYVEVLMRSFQQDLTFKVADLIRELSNSPIVAFPTPMPSARIVDEHRNWANFREPRLRQRLWTLSREAAAAAGRNGTAIVFQPEHTVVDDIFTDDVFSQDSVRLHDGKPHQENDYYHMNAKFGAAALERILSSL